MLSSDFLNAILDDAIEEVRLIYLKPSQDEKRRGGMDAFEACRGKTFQEIVQIRDDAAYESSSRRIAGKLENYWYWRFYEVQVDWVLDVLSARDHLERRPVRHPVSIRGTRRAMEILGLREPIGVK